MGFNSGLKGLIALACSALSIAKELPPFCESVLARAWTYLGNDTAARASNLTHVNGSTYIQVWSPSPFKVIVVLTAFVIFGRCIA
jgi:hypothetical protein